MAKYVPYHLMRQQFAVEKTKPGKDDSDIVNYVLKQVVRKVGDGDEDFVIEEVTVEESRVNRQQWIAKDAPDVGVMNIIEKVRRSGDMTLFNQTHNIYEASGELDSLGRPYGIVQDYTNIPSTIGEALASVDSGAEAFAGLKAIFPDATFEELAQMSAADIQAAVSAYVASNAPKTEEGVNQ